MSKYMELDELMQKLDIEEECWDCNANAGGTVCLRGDEFVNVCSAIFEASTIDIVFCNECKYCTYRIDYKMNYCIRLAQMLFNVNGYCSWGEREGE